MDSVEQIFNDDLMGFKARPRFFGLFAFLYDIAFGVGSKLKRTTPTALPPGIRECLSQASESIENKTAPATVLGALAKRTTHPKSRRTVVTYLKRTCGIG